MSRSLTPVPSVPRHVRGKRKLRKARGFSLGELKQAGLQEFAARSMRIRVDGRRSTIHAQNITALTGFLASSTQKVAAPELSVEAAAVVSEPKKAPAPRKRKTKSNRAKPATKRKR